MTSQEIPIGEPKEGTLCLPMKVKDLRFLDIFSEHLYFLPDNAEVLFLHTNLWVDNICKPIEGYDAAYRCESDVWLGVKVDNVFMEIKYNLPEKKYAITWS